MSLYAVKEGTFFFCFAFTFFFFFIHSMDTKPIFYFFTPYRNCTHACKVTSVLSCCLRPMECSTPGSYVHGNLQAKILEWVAIPSFRGSSQPRNWTSVSYVPSRQAGSLLLEPPAKPILLGISIYQDFQFSPVNQSCPTLWDPMDCSMPSLPVHHKIPEFTQTHVHWVGDAIQQSHPLSHTSPPTFHLSQHQGLFKRVSSLH